MKIGTQKEHFNYKTILNSQKSSLLYLGLVINDQSLTKSHERNETEEVI